MKKLIYHLVAGLLVSTPMAFSQTFSGFDSGDEGWTVVDHQWPFGPYTTPIGGPFAPVYAPSGGNPGGQITATDRPGSPASYFQAPSSFLGDQGILYGRTLSYQVRSPPGGVGFSMADVVLVGGGLTLTIDAGTDPGNVWTSYTVPLSENGAWNKSSGGAPSAAEFQSVLSSLTALRIRAEYGDGAGASLDNVSAVPEPAAVATAGGIGLGMFALLRAYFCRNTRRGKS